MSSIGQNFDIFNSPTSDTYTDLPPSYAEATSAPPSYKDAVGLSNKYLNEPPPSYDSVFKNHPFPLSNGNNNIDNLNIRNNNSVAYHIESSKNSLNNTSFSSIFSDANKSYSNNKDLLPASNKILTDRDRSTLDMIKVFDEKYKKIIKESEELYKAAKRLIDAETNHLRLMLEIREKELEEEKRRRKMAGIYV